PPRADGGAPGTGGAAAGRASRAPACTELVAIAVVGRPTAPRRAPGTEILASFAGAVRAGLADRCRLADPDGDSDPGCRPPRAADPLRASRAVSEDRGTGTHVLRDPAAGPAHDDAHGGGPRVAAAGTVPDASARATRCRAHAAP